jgi:hypothetical protein
LGDRPHQQTSITSKGQDFWLNCLRGCSGDQPQPERLTGFTIASLNSGSLLRLFLVFDAYLKSVFNMAL